MHLVTPACIASQFLYGRPPAWPQEEKDAAARRRAWRKLELDALELYAHMLKQCASGARPMRGKGKAKPKPAPAEQPPAKRARRGGDGDGASGSAAAAPQKPDKEVLQAQVRLAVCRILCLPAAS